jgi:hypothetical protein
VELGRKQNYRHWSRRELDVVDRYAQGLVDGRYASVDQAAGPGRRALIASGCAERPGHGIANQLLRRAHLHGRPLRDWFWTDEELRKLDPVARDYAAYKFPNVAAAAAAGLRALGGSCPKGPRTLSGAEHAILQLARVHGRNQSWWLWSEAEIKVCDSWIRWYQRYRRVRRLRPAKVAADGLREELQYMGSERTLAACRTYFYKRRLHLLGMA